MPQEAAPAELTIGPARPHAAARLARSCAAAQNPPEIPRKPARSTSMELGAFSISLSVKDLDASRAFYEALGFSVTGGDAAQNWLVLRNANTVVGLFKGMFEGNWLTFNPGWDQQAKPLPGFTDIRQLQAQLDASGVPLSTRADHDGNGPAHVMLSDPDGNVILIDQHVPRPSP